MPYSGGLGSIGAVMIVDYWLIRRRRLSLVDLYLPGRQLSLRGRLELAGAFGHRRRLLPVVGRPSHPVLATAFRLRLVRRLLHLGRRVLRPDAGGAAQDVRVGLASALRRRS